MFYLLWQTFFWIALAVAAGILIGWWIWHRRSHSYESHEGTSSVAHASENAQRNDTEAIRLNNLLQQEQSRTKSYQDEISALKSQLKTDQSKAFSAGSFVNEDGNEIDQKAYSHLESQLTAAKSAHQKCDVEIAKLNSELASQKSLVDEAKTMSEKVGQLEAQLNAAKSAHQNCDNDIVKLKSELASQNALTDEAKAASEKISNLESQLSEANEAAEKVGNLESQLNAALSAHKNCDNDITNLKHQLADAKAQIENANTTSHQAEELKSQLSATTSDLDSYKKQYNEQLSKNQKLTDDLKIANQNAGQHTNTAEHSERLSNELEQSRQQLAHSKREISRLETDNAQLALSLDNAKQASTRSQAFTAGNFDSGSASEADKISGDDEIRPSPSAVDDSFRPVSLSQPEDGGADDLTKISGVGPKLNSTLNDLGIYHYHQIAGFSRENVEWVDGYLSFKGRIDREEWIPQAKVLMGDPGQATASSGDHGKPSALSAPEGGKADDLTLIKGIGPKLNGLLNDLGIYHFHQIASFNADNVEWVDGYLSFKGRIDREQWISQAQILARGGETEFSKRQDS